MAIPHRDLPTSKQIRQDFLDFFRSKGHTIVPSASLLPDAPNLLFTNAGMNQFVPIFLGERKCPYHPPRAADTQKCIRAGGKHNDLEDVGLDTYHHTFFEMLGNWSFGDYFKKEAIDWAWQLITEVWQFPRHRLYATVYSPDKSRGDPAEFDHEASACWSEKFSAAGLDPAIHIRPGGPKDNFWMMGETGPCGPCSEIHVDLTARGDSRGALVNRGSAECIEIWNLVFIQFNANPDKSLTVLPARHVDTGMGFERVTGIIQNTENFRVFSKTISNYESDIFRPLFDKIERLSGKVYRATIPAPGGSGQNEQEKVDIAFRVIADHIRTLSFAIADGIVPGNTDRHYVLRRILRRAVRYGRSLGVQEPFFHHLVSVLAETMGEVFPELRLRQSQVETVIHSEEEAFNKTLDRGIELFREELERLKPPPGSPSGMDSSGGGARPDRSSTLSGNFAFKLYDTYGFPLDLTELMAREHGLAVETAQFDELMEAQRQRARAAQRREVISVSALDQGGATRFEGYDCRETEATVLEVIQVREKTAVVVDRSTFYAEMGGQVGDAGELEGETQVWHVATTQKSGQTWLHFLAGADAPPPGARLQLRVDRSRRASIQRHHSVTHLLHWALHEVVNPETAQKGSFVGPDKLTFDFNSAALAAGQLRDVEKLVNERIVENAAVSWVEVPFQEVRQRRDIMQFFGEKYGDLVRVVQIGGSPARLDGYSMELCAGTHTRATGEIGLFRIEAESAIAAGVRRIEATAGLAAYQKACAETHVLRAAAGKINAPAMELEKRIESLLQQQKELEKQVKAAQQQRAAEVARELAGKAAGYGRGENGGNIPAIIENLGPADSDLLQAVADALKNGFRGVTVLAGTANEAVFFVAAVSPEFIGKVHAGKLLQAIAPIVDGKGGGKPENARGGGRNSARTAEALEKAKTLLASIV